MRWGKMAVLGLTAIVGLGLGLAVAQPWSDLTPVEAITLSDQLDQARRDDDDGSGTEVRDDDDDGDGNGGGGNGPAGGTTDGRDGSFDGDTGGGQGSRTATNGGGGNGPVGGTTDGRDGSFDGNTGGGQGSRTATNGRRRRRRGSHLHQRRRRRRRRSHLHQRRRRRRRWERHRWRQHLSMLLSPTGWPPGNVPGGLTVLALGRLRSSITVRILVAFVLIMAIATLASIVIVRQTSLAGVDRRIDEALVQESRELRRLVDDGVDPETGEPFGNDVRRIIQVFLERNVPARNEAFLTFVDGEPFERSRNVLPYRLDEDPALVGRWAGVTMTDAGSVETPGGTVRYLAVPIRAQGEVRGVFVAAIFRDLEAQSIDPAVRAGALVGVAALLIGSLLAFLVARRIIQPVQAVQATARTISESDLSRRIAVTGDDEIAHLAETFNELLDRLERAFSAQRAFVDDAGHELRTPITIIRGQLELLSDDPGQRRRSIALVTGELDRMSRMVNDLLMLAKAQQPEFLEFDLVDVETLTREVHEKGRVLGERRWTLERAGDGTLVGDRQRLGQAMIQLLQNAVDHTDVGDEISLGSSIEDGHARFWVRDTGPGIPAQLRDRIFDRFTRVGSRRSEGAGLGLSIVRTIVEGHGGKVWVDSEVGEGTTFTLEVPVDQDPAGTEVA